MGTYNVPALVQVKAPQIKVQQDAYTNPQPLYNKAYEEYAKIAPMIAEGAIALNNQKAQYIRDEKTSLENMSKQAGSNFSTNMLSISELGNTGNSKFDKNKMDFFLDLKHQFTLIQNRIAENPELAASGAQQLAKINSMVYQFKEAAPKMLSQIVWLQDKLKMKSGVKNSLSSAFPTAMSRMLLAVGGNGNANVTIINKDGQLVLFAPDQTYMENGKEVHLEATALNVNKFLQYDEQNPGGAIPLIEDWQTEVNNATEESLSFSMGANGQTPVIEPKFVKTEKLTSKDGLPYDYTSWRKEIIDPKTNKPIVGDAQGTNKEYLNIDGLRAKILNPYYNQSLNGRDLAMLDLITGGTFNSMLNPEDGNDITMQVWWKDVIGDPTNEFGEPLDGYDGIAGQDSEWDVNDTEKVALALDWFAEQGLKAYEQSLGIQGAPESQSGMTRDQYDKFQKLKTSDEWVRNLYTDIENIKGSPKDVASYFKGKQYQGKFILGAELVKSGTSGEGGLTNTVEFTLSEPTKTKEQILEIINAEDKNRRSIITDYTEFENEDGETRYYKTKVGIEEDDAIKRRVNLDNDDALKNYLMSYITSTYGKNTTGTQRLDLMEQLLRKIKEQKKQDKINKNKNPFNLENYTKE